MKTFLIYYWQTTSNVVQVEAATKAQARRRFEDMGPECGISRTEEISDEGIASIEEIGEEIRI